MDKVQFPYRSESHLPFLHVVGQSGSWEKHGLQVEYDKYISSEDAHANVANGSVEFVGGNHLSPYSSGSQDMVHSHSVPGAKCEPAQPSNGGAARLRHIQSFGSAR